MASREMIDVLQRLRELDKDNPNVITDALENTEKMNPPVEEAKKLADKDYDGDGKKETPAQEYKGSKDKAIKKAMGKKEKTNESITISADSPEDLPVIAQIMKLAGMQPVSTDMMPDVDNVPAMKADDNINGNGSDCGCDDNPVVTKRDGVDFDLDRDGMPDMTYDNSPDENYQGVEAVTTDAGVEGLNGKSAPQDIRVKDSSPYADYEQRLAKLAGIENEEVEDEETDEGYANSMGNEKEEPTYKGYDPDYGDHTEHGKPKVKYIPSRYGDNPLESIEQDLKAKYEQFKK